MLELCAQSLDDTEAIAAAVATQSRSGDLIVLAGEMGAGKTAFAKGFGRSLGITEPITSPTFTLVHSYDIDPSQRRVAKALHHADLYRLERTAEIADLALDELAEYDGIVLVEWGDVAESLFGDHLVVHLRSDDGDDGDDGGDGGDQFTEASSDARRLIEISATGASWAARWSALTDACGEFRC